MSKKQRSSLKNPRKQAFKTQHGVCYYCSQPMWTEAASELTDQYPISAKQARWLQCTGEHLIAHKDGGSAKQENIVAACRHCNTKRHARDNEMPVEQYRRHVQKRMKKGAWHSVRPVLRQHSGK